MLINNGDLSFTENADNLGIGFNGIGWGAQFEDFDLDGFEDLYVSGGYEGTELVSSAFYFNNQGINFRKDNTIGFNRDTVSSFGNAIGDINNQKNEKLLSGSKIFYGDTIIAVSYTHLTLPTKRIV